MTKVLGVCLLLLTASPVVGQKKSCEQLAAEIAERLDAKGIKGYKLDIVAAGEAGSKQVVGTCEGGEKKITYEKVAAAKK
jgi:hypothetical protein